jgi:hypothetical protein
MGSKLEYWFFLTKIAVVVLDVMIEDGISVVTVIFEWEFILFRHGNHDWQEAYIRPAPSAYAGLLAPLERVGAQVVFFH